MCFKFFQDQQSGEEGSRSRCVLSAETIELQEEEEEGLVVAVLIGGVVEIL